jgi:uncharacterized protein (DUF2062 family)
MNPRKWLHEHSLKLLAIRDTPEAIAGGVAIGVFFGFMPLFGLKTLLAILVAWLTGSNILAAVISGALHDVILPLMPMIYRWEYDVGYWLLSSPHHWPAPLLHVRFEAGAWHHWRRWYSVGKPLLMGGILFSAPAAVLGFFITRSIVARHQRKKSLQAPAAPPEEANPS